MYCHPATVRPLLKAAPTSRKREFTDQDSLRKTLATRSVINGMTAIARTGMRAATENTKAGSVAPKTTLNGSARPEGSGKGRLIEL
jgi:hypothetical protein